MKRRSPELMPVAVTIPEAAADQARTRAGVWPFAGLARRCDCPRPCVIATDSGPRCLKCGRWPAPPSRTTGDPR